MSASKSLALLICGSLSPNLLDQYGDYTVVFGKFLRSALPDVDFALDPYDVRKMEYPSEETIDSYDGVLLTGSVLDGSAASAYENVEWINKLVAYVDRIATDKPRIKIIGICFGHQIIGRALGAECVPNGGKWEVGPTTVELTDLGKSFFGTDVVSIQQMHRDHVPTVPPTFHLLGSTPVSYNQGMVRFSPDAGPEEQDLKDVQIFTVQGHPEFDEGIVSGLVEVRAKSGVFSAEVAADAERRRKWRNDGVPVLGKAIWAVLGVAA